jgi:hypothetical protein
LGFISSELRVSGLKVEHGKELGFSFARLALYCIPKSSRVSSIHVPVNIVYTHPSTPPTLLSTTLPLPIHPTPWILPHTPPPRFPCQLRSSLTPHARLAEKYNLDILPRPLKPISIFEFLGRYVPAVGLRYYGYV